MNAIEEAKREQRRQHVPPTSAYQQLVAPTASRSIALPSVRVGANPVAPVSNRVSAFVPFSPPRTEDLLNETPGNSESTRESSIRLQIFHPIRRDPVNWMKLLRKNRCNL